MPESALNDDNSSRHIHTLNAKSLLFAVPGILVKSLQITGESFSICIGVHKGRRDDEPMKGPGLQSAFQSAPEGNAHRHTKEELKGKGGVQHSFFLKDTAVYLQRESKREKILKAASNTHTHRNPSLSKRL